nr:neutral zinc metallopeptidase [Actinomadura sp. GC306]
MPGPPGYGPPPYGPPGRPPVQPPYAHQYRYVPLRPPLRPPPRRSAGGTVAGILGALASVAVIAILGATFLVGQSGAATTNRPPITSGGGGSAREQAVGNKLYESGALTPVSCRVPAIQPSSASMRRFMNVLSDCLDSSWSQQFGKAGMRFDEPDRVFWDQPGRSPCGTYPAPGASAFYCPANNTMYIGVRHVVETSGGEPLSNWAVFARVIAHEYGHHVQHRAGILLYGNRLMDTGDIDRRNEASRRIELQAQCFAGAFLGAERVTLPMTQAQFNAMIRDVRGRGDERLPPEKRDHGSGRAYAGWVVTGYEGRRLAVCNTWTVPSSKVN